VFLPGWRFTAAKFAPFIRFEPASKRKSIEMCACHQTAKENMLGASLVFRQFRCYVRLKTFRPLKRM
jgi:hypothetical protein